MPEYKCSAERVVNEYYYHDYKSTDLSKWHFAKTCCWGTLQN